MTQISIPLYVGENYVAFPEGSTNNFRTIFTNSGIISDIVTLYRYDPILESFVQINLDLETIQQGRGYILTVSFTGNPVPTIVYEGVPFSNSMNFGILKSMLMKGWNLIGTDTNTINVENWCRCIDGQTGLETHQILPLKSYWISTDECEKSSKDMVLILTLGIFLLSIYETFIKGAKYNLRSPTGGAVY